MDAYRQLTPQSEITRFCCDDTSTHIVFTQNLPRAYLPPIARTVMPVDMVITREQHFEPYDHNRNRARGTYGASIPAGPGHFGGKYFLTDTRDGSRLWLASVCKVWIPFVGGKLEDLILSNIRLLFDAKRRSPPIGSPNTTDDRVLAGPAGLLQIGGDAGDDGGGQLGSAAGTFKQPRRPRSSCCPSRSGSTDIGRG